MSLRTVMYPSAQMLPVSTGNCQQVYLCLTPTWAARIAGGDPFLLATVSSGRYLGSAGMAFAPRFENPRGELDYQYELSYESTDLINDPGTGQPYILPCDAIVEVVPYVCTINKLISLL